MEPTHSFFIFKYMNGLKTAVLLASLSAIIMMIGYASGGQDGMTFAFIIAIMMNFGSYWFSDKIVLGMYHARIVEQNEAPALHRIVDELCARAGMIKPRIAVVDLPVPNAFATGRNQKHAVVAVTSSILQVLSENELRAVIAHELGHIKNKDILISSVSATLATVISYLAQMAMYFGGGSRDHDRGNILQMLLMMILAPIMASIIQMAISRSREYGADDRSAEFTGAPLDLARALEKLEAYSQNMPIQAKPKQQATAHLFIVNPFRSSVMARLFSTHPPIEDRIARLKAM
jgi:heat shock protein HtpX